MNRNTVMRQIVLFIIGSVINLGMFCLSKYAGFPIWADFAGSVYITALCGAVGGGISIVLHTLIMCILIDGSYALWLALPAIIACAAVYVLKRLNSDSLSPTVIGCGASVSSVLTFFALWLSFAASGFHGRREVLLPFATNINSQVICAAGVALLETALTFIVFYIIYIITPKNNEILKFKR